MLFGGNPAVLPPSLMALFLLSGLLFYLFPGGFIEGGDVFSGDHRRLPVHGEGEVRCEKRKKGLHVTACPRSTICLDSL